MQWLFWEGHFSLTTLLVFLGKQLELIGLPVGEQSPRWTAQPMAENGLILSAFLGGEMLLPYLSHCPELESLEKIGLAGVVGWVSTAFCSRVVNHL